MKGRHCLLAAFDVLNRVYIIVGIYVFAMAACLLALARGGKYEKWIQSIEGSFAKLAGKPLWAALALFLGIIVIRVSVLPLIGVPIPAVHDEFSYLLLSDTLAHGRLTNPPPDASLIKSFETFHENFTPTYHSKYAPMQGVVLAFGQILGNPWIGVLLSAAAMGAIFFLALRLWIPPHWAFLAAILVALRLEIASYWMNSYWGGVVAAIGGALVLGGLGAILRRGTFLAALAFSAGIIILSNCRPYEGAIYCLPAAAVFLWWAFGKCKSAPAWRDRVGKVVLPVGILLLANVLFIGYYNWRLTGDPKLFPMTLNQRLYDSSAIFVWEKPGPPRFHNNPQFDDMYNRWQRNIYKHTWTDYKKVAWKKVLAFKIGYLWWDLILIAPGFYCAFRRRRLIFLWVVFGFNLLAYYSVAWTLPHYVAPSVCIVFALIAAAMREMSQFSLKGYSIGLFLSRIAVFGLLLQVANVVATGHQDMSYIADDGLESREEVARKLQKTEGKHLVFVHYSAAHNSNREWVFNSADIEGSKIVWARELDAEQNQNVLEHFRDRKAWIVEADRFMAPIEPYNRSAAKQ